jgi:4-amino-4-deoxy-L-arabinose transferase-like glycosyltransferase
VISVLPFMIIVGILTIEKLFSDSRNALFLQKTFMFAILLVFIYSSVEITKGSINERNKLYEKYSRLKEYLSRNEKNEPVIMTEFPIEINYSTGYKSVMIPEDSDSVLFSFSKRYDVNYLLTPTLRVSIQNLNSADKFDLKYIDPYTDLKLYKFLSDPDAGNIPGK